MVWDGLAGAIYFITGRWKLFMAVIKAHNGFRAMKAEEQQDSFNDSLGYIPQHELKHCFNGHILVQAIIRGKKTFASLNQALFQKAVKSLRRSLRAQIQQSSLYKLEIRD